MDAVDSNIAYLLGKNGRMSNREIGRRLGIAEGTVRQRLGRMIDSGAIRISAQANIEMFPDHYIALVGVKIDGRQLNESARQIEALPPVLTTSIVTGHYDIICTVLAPSRHTLVDFVTEHLSKVDGVKDSETYVVLKNFGQWIPADKLFAMDEDEIPGLD